MEKNSMTTVHILKSNKHKYKTIRFIVDKHGGLIEGKEKITDTYRLISLSLIESVREDWIKYKSEGYLEQK